MCCVTSSADQHIALRSLPLTRVSDVAAEIGHTEPHLLIIELVGGAKFLLLDLCAENYNTQRIFVASRSTYEMRPDHLLTFVFFDWKLGT